MNVRSIDLELPICGISARNELKIQSIRAFSVSGKMICLENEEFLKVMNSFFDLDQIVSIERSCAHYTLNLICCRRLL